MLNWLAQGEAEEQMMQVVVQAEAGMALAVEAEAAELSLAH